MSDKPGGINPHTLVRALSFILLPIALALLATQGLQFLDKWMPQSVVSSEAMLSESVGEHSPPSQDTSESLASASSQDSLPSSASVPESVPSSSTALPSSASSDATPSVPSVDDIEEDDIEEDDDIEGISTMVEHEELLPVGQVLRVPAVGYAKVLYAGEKQGEGKVALTFDSGWLFEPTETLLSVLGAKHVTATFFLRGGWIEANPDLVKLIHAGGHEIGNHSYTHGHLPEMSAEEVQSELSRTRQALYEVLGPVAQPYYRPPYGEYNDRDVQEAGSLGFRYTVMWSIDSIDWMDPGEEEILTRVGHNLEDGGIALMHVGVWQTANVLPKVIDALRERGLEPVPLSELISWDDYLEDYIAQQGDSWESVAYHYAISTSFLKQLNAEK